MSAFTGRLCCPPGMKLEQLVRGVPGATLEGNGDVEITGIAYDSRRVKPGDLFVAVEGLRADGHAFVGEALTRSAAAVAVDRDVNVPAGTPLVRMQSTRSGLAEVAAEFFGRPSRRLKVAGITGTDGKTTTTHMAEHVLQASGVMAGAMSTVSFTVGGRETDNQSGQTTIEATEVQAWLARMVEAGGDYAGLETTSHALGQERGRATPIDAVGTGLAGFEGVRGRLEAVDLGQDFRVFIDFAHSAGALASALAELRPFTPGRLIVVFGSTARSDHDRPGMGRAAAEFADFFIITTDDPLQQDPVEIARDVQEGVEGKAPGLDYEIVIDRGAAIRRAIELARPGDCVLLAGKGHERTMRMASGSEPWDERAEAEAAINERLALR